MNRIRKGDTVRVVAGKDKSREGKVLGFSHNGKRVLVEGLNIVKRHSKPTTQNPAGGIVEKEAGIHLSNVMPLTPSGHPTRVAFVLDDSGKKVRYSRKHDEYLD